MSKKQLSYNEALIEIETIINKIENQELNIDELSENVKRVSELLNFCKLKLRKTEEEVQKIIKDLDE